MKRITSIIIILLSSISIQAQPAWCTAERLTKIESFICSDSALSQADILLTQVYSSLMSYKGQKGHKGRWGTKIQKQQRAWLKKRNKLSSKAILMKAYLTQTLLLYPELLIHNNIEEKENKPLSNIKHIYNAIINNNPNQLASLIIFPTILMVNGKRLILKKKLDFTQRYPALFPKIYRERIATEKPSPKMFKNYKGIMLGDGILWFNEKGELKALNQE